MLWVDVAGPPGSGKSTLCYPVWGDRSVIWDGLLPPVAWQPFLDEVTGLMEAVREHRHPETDVPTIRAVWRMCDRSAKKMAAVARMPMEPPSSWVLDIAPWCFVQTGFVQRVLGFGWRLAGMGKDVGLIRPALLAMPVSVGVAFLEASPECVKARNRARRGVAATAHEDRSYQVEPMLPAIRLAKDVLRERGVPVLEIDVEHQSVDDARAELLAFARAGVALARAGFVAGSLAQARGGRRGGVDAAEASREPEALGPGGEGTLFCAPPPWWRS